MHKLLILLFVVCNFSLYSCSSKETAYIDETQLPQHFVAGNIVSIGSNIIPSDAIITVQLNDVSLMDVASITLGKEKITGITHFPVPFNISYNPKLIIKGMSYTVSARIEKDGKLLFINDTHIPVFNDFIKNDFHEIDLPVIQIKPY